MKKQFKNYAMTFLMLFITIASFGMVQDEIPIVDLSNTGVLIGIAAPIVVFFITKMFKNLVPKMNGMYTIAFTTVVAGLYTWISQVLAQPDLSWVLTLFLGLLSIAVDQIHYQLSNQSTVDREILNKYRK